MSKSLFITPLFLVSQILAAQEESTQYIHKHLVRSDASIVSGYMFKSDLKNVHLNGNLEYYMDNRVSIRGDANYLLGSTGISADSMSLQDDISVMLGPVFHIHTNNHLDPYFILQPGVAYTSSYSGKKILNNDSPLNDKKFYCALSPLASAGIGFNYYFQRFAHLFMETRYVYGQHLSAAPAPLSLQEVRITFGLGFNLFIIKEKRPA